MGYKRIESAIHNLAHSFMSLMNYVDGQYIIDLMPKLIRETPGHEIRVSLLDAAIHPHRDYDPAFLKSIGYYRTRVRSHLESENVDPATISSFHFVIYCDNDEPICDAEATDDRGVLHRSTARGT